MLFVSGVSVDKLPSKNSVMFAGEVTCIVEKVLGGIGRPHREYMSTMVIKLSPSPIQTILQTLN